MQSPLGLQSKRQAERGRGFGSHEPFITRDCLFHRQWESRQGYKQNCNQISSYTPCDRFYRRWEGTKDEHLGSTDEGNVGLICSIVRWKMKQIYVRDTCHCFIPWKRSVFSHQSYLDLLCTSFLTWSGLGVTCNDILHPVCKEHTD